MTHQHVNKQLHSVEITLLVKSHHTRVVHKVRGLSQ